MCKAHNVPVRIPCSQAVPAESIVMGIIFLESRGPDHTGFIVGVLRLDLATPTIAPEVPEDLLPFDADTSLCVHTTAV